MRAAALRKETATGFETDLARTLPIVPTFGRIHKNTTVTVPDNHTTFTRIVYLRFEQGERRPARYGQLTHLPCMVAVGRRSPNAPAQIRTCPLRHPAPRSGVDGIPSGQPCRSARDTLHPGALCPRVSGSASGACPSLRVSRCAEAFAPPAPPPGRPGFVRRLPHYYASVRLLRAVRPPLGSAFTLASPALRPGRRGDLPGPGEVLTYVPGIFDTAGLPSPWRWSGCCLRLPRRPRHPE